MRYVIIGAGAIGGTLGARLAQGSEHPPLLIARGEHGAAIAAEGLRLRTPDEDVSIPIDVAAGPADVILRADDVLVLATKTQQAQAALEQWVDVAVYDESGAVVGTAGEKLPVFLALNGVESERIALRLFDRVFGVTVWLPAVHLVPGEIILRIAPRSGVFIVGRYGPAATEQDAALLATLTADWNASSFEVHVVDDVMRWKYSKLLSNLGNAPQALLGNGSGAGEVSSRLVAEGKAVLEAAGIEWATDAEEEAWRGDLFSIRPVAGTPTELGGSSWQSLARGSGSIETDYLNGEIALIARSVGVDAPLNAAIQRLTRQAAASGAGAGSMTTEQVTEILDTAAEASGGDRAA
jgi:2-dehydropantoate 2-reductase